MITLWNAEMGIFYPQKPNGLFTSVRKKKKIRKLHLLVLNSANGGILREEEEFKPSFNEYLKAMESMKSGQEKNRVLQPKRHNSEEDESRAKIGSEKVSPKKQEEEEDVKLANSEKSKSPKLVKRREVNLNGKGGSTSKNPKANFVSVKVLPKTEKEDVKLANSEKAKSPKIVKRREVYLNGEGAGTSKNPKANFVSVTVLPKKDKEDVKLVKFRDFSEKAKTPVPVKHREGHLNGVGAGTSKNFRAFLKEDNTRRSDVERAAFRNLEEFNGAGAGAGTSKNFRAYLKEDNTRIIDVERAAFRNLEEFNGVLDQPRVSHMEMEVRTEKLAKMLHGADIDMPEWVFSKMMRSAQIRYSDHSILRLIQTLGKLENWRRVIQVIEWLQMRERFRSNRLRRIYTTALSVLQKARKPVEALNLFRTMQQQMSTYPDLVAYHCIATTLGQAGYVKELFDVVDSMRSPPNKKFKNEALGYMDPRLEPDLVVYNSILNACGKQKQWEGAFWVLQQLKNQGIRPSTATYGLVMEVMLLCGKYNLVHEFFRKMEKSSIPNALAYRVLVNALWKEGKVDEAVLTVQDMERRGVVGSAALYYDLARCLCSAGRCQEALLEIQKMCKFANKPLLVTYTGLIQASVESGNIENVTYIFNQMREVCSPNLATCNIVLKAYLDHGQFDEATKLFHKMSDNSSVSDYKKKVIPDIYTFNLMLDACAREQRWDDFDQVYRTMLLQGYQFNAKHHQRTILSAARAGKEELLETTWENLVRDSKIPPVPLIKERFCMKLEKHDFASALSCISNFPLSESTESTEFSKTLWLKLLKENAQRFRHDTVVQLLHEIDIFISRTDSSRAVLYNLLTACKEFVRV